jgi:hypothetical protein
MKIFSKHKILLKIKQKSIKKNKMKLEENTRKLLVVKKTSILEKK